MIEQFKFYMVVTGVEKPILLAKLIYSRINGLQIVTKRQMFVPNPENGEMMPLVDQLLENIRFNNGFTVEGLAKNVL